MGLLANLFSPKTIGDLAKSAVKGLDDVVYTDQERAEKTEAGQKLYAKLYMAALPSALSRRIIAAITVSVWAFLVILAAVVWSFNEEWSKFILELLKEIILQPVNLILSFYFLKAIATEFRKE